jgi:uncharacterized radical SAM superfamily Fe-S cluster-containing enzyme
MRSSTRALDPVRSSAVWWAHTHLPLSDHAPRDLGRHVFMIHARDFMDPWNFNVKNVMKCCVEFIIPDGRMIPFCVYNSVGYREQVTQSLVRNATSHQRSATK